MNGNKGKVVQIIGPVVDCEFEEKHLPPIYNCVIIEGNTPDGHMRVSTEVQQHLGESRVRCVSMQPTDGMVRGMDAIDIGVADHCPRRARHARPRHERDRRTGRPIGRN